MEQDSNTPAPLGDLLSVLSDERVSIMKKLYENGPLRYTEMGIMCGYKMSNNESGKFRYHMHHLIESGLITKDSGYTGMYSLTPKGKIIFVGINAIQGAIDGLDYPSEMVASSAKQTKIDAALRKLQQMRKELDDTIDTLQSNGKVEGYALRQSEPAEAEKFGETFNAYTAPIAVMEFRNAPYTLSEICSKIETRYGRKPNMDLTEDYLKRYEREGFVKRVRTGHSDSKWKLLKMPEKSIILIEEEKRRLQKS